MILNSENIGNEIHFLFNKYYFIENTGIDFSESKFYEQALEKFKLDYNRYFSDDVIIREKFYSRIELIGILLYRIAREYFIGDKEEIALHFSNLGRIIAGFEIYYSADIGKALKINHGLGTVIGARCVIGNDALIHQNVTFGDKNGGRPTLLDGVTVYAGAKILGPIILGNHAVVAANCVCMIDVPDNGVVVGVPGVIKIK